MIHSLRAATVLLPMLALAGCVTINIYFPAAAAERAADRIIDEVWQYDAAPADDEEEGEQ